MEAMLEKPSAQDQQVASASLPYFAAIHQLLVSKSSQQVDIHLLEQTQAVAIPRRAFELLEVILLAMAQGQALSLLPTETELSTQEAAALLHVSRPHLVKLLEQGLIPFKKVGSHRRVQLVHLLRYEQQQAEQREQHLQFLAQQAQELNMGYE